MSAKLPVDDPRRQTNESELARLRKIIDQQEILYGGAEGLRIVLEAWQKETAKDHAEFIKQHLNYRQEG
jgi:hypothetical protein